MPMEFNNLAHSRSRDKQAIHKNLVYLTNRLVTPLTPLQCPACANLVHVLTRLLERIPLT
jgi:hypothetical protein